MQIATVFGAFPTVSLFFATTVTAQVRPDEPHTFLRTHIGYTDADLKALDAGKAVTRAIDTDEPREVAISGAVHIRATTDFFLRMYKDIERFDTAALAIKKISDPPEREDFTTMSIPEKELATLRTCKPDDCNMKLGQVTMDLLASSIDWSAPGATRRAEESSESAPTLGRWLIWKTVATPWALTVTRKSPGSSPRSSRRF